MPLIPSDDATPPLFTGRWDFIPVIAPDSVPAMVRVTPNGDVWIAGNGTIVRRKADENAFMVMHRADGRPDPIPAIISHDMIVLGDDRVLVSSIWRELFIAGSDGISEVSPRDIRGAFSFADLPDGLLAVGLNDWRIDDTFPETISETLGREVLLVRGIERLVVVGDTLFGIDDDRFFQIDIETGDRGPGAVYTTASDGIASVRPTADGQILIAATPHYGVGGCYLLNPTDPAAATRLYDGPCYDLAETAPGEIWASTDKGVYRFDGAMWRRYFPDGPAGLGGQAMFALTATGSLWTASALGLWRHFLHTREIPTPTTDEITALHRDSAGRLFLADETNAVYVLDDGRWQQALPAAEDRTYSRMPLFAEMPNGGVAVLHPIGLFRFDGAEPVKLAELPELVGSVAPSTLAICPNGDIFVGLVWAPAVLELTSGSWVDAHYTTATDVGGTGISDVECDARGNLWVLGNETVALRQADGKWLETEPFLLRANAKKNLFGTLLPSADALAATAWGSWGYPVEVRVEKERIVAEQKSLSSQAPYSFYDAWRIDERAAILTDRGVFLWREGDLSRMPLVEERLQRAATALFAVEDPESAFGFSLYVGAGGSLSLVKPVRHVPALAAPELADRVVTAPAARLEFSADGRAYPPAEGSLRVAFDPPLPDGAVSNAVPGRPITVTGLAPDTRYEVRAIYTDAAGQVSNPVVGSLTYDRPLRDDPRAWALLGLLLLAGLVLLVRSSAVLDLLLRRLGGRRWQVLLGTVDRTVSLSLDESGSLEAELSAPGAILTLNASSETAAAEIKAIRMQTRAMSALALSTREPKGRAAFSAALADLSWSMNDTLPEPLRFELQSFESESLLLEVSRELSALPWDLLSGPRSRPISVGPQIARTIRSNRLAAHPGLEGRLRAAIFRAEAKQGAPEALIWSEECDSVERAMRRSGVRDVRVQQGGSGRTAMRDWLDGNDIVHFMGHASADGSIDGSARFWLTEDETIDQDGLRHLLEDIKRPPALVFINACGALQQRDDLGGAALAGLATPFLEIGSTVLGTQWPVQTAFATELAVEFYRRALPPPNALLWRWLRRRPLEGQTFAGALSAARERLHARSPDTDPTWSSYTIFGNPTARLSLS
ncbi:CHAT domain-containing protein [Leisingera aquaemixtae]|uniref:CHAT domain-containing protein n=1 Tax=Leisingera aquaemixtae TaxID=1396826 RepID=UPI0021A49615|nr:CHAT domain-containing protein [Leisingera aquaemixtae]UWQ36563.1 CHAT domain-containing protein [Leisingera aquaemixtae]